MGWRGLVVTTVPVHFQPVCRKNLEDSFQLWNVNVNIVTILTLESWNGRDCCMFKKTKSKMKPGRLLTWQTLYNYEFERVFQELRWWLGVAGSVVALVLNKYLLHRCPVGIQHHLLHHCQSSNTWLQIWCVFPALRHQILSVAPFEERGIQSQPQNAGHTSHNQV